MVLITLITYYVKILYNTNHNVLHCDFPPFSPFSAIFSHFLCIFLHFPAFSDFLPFSFLPFSMLMSVLVAIFTFIKFNTSPLPLPKFVLTYPDLSKSYQTYDIILITFWKSYITTTSPFGHILEQIGSSNH